MILISNNNLVDRDCDQQLLLDQSFVQMLGQIMSQQSMITLSMQEQDTQNERDANSSFSLFYCRSAPLCESFYLFWIFCSYFLSFPIFFYMVFCCFVLVLWLFMGMLCLFVGILSLLVVVLCLCMDIVVLHTSEPSSRVFTQLSCSGFHGYT